MSTKIYNAFWFKGNLSELKKEIDRIGEKLIKFYSNQLQAYAKTTLFDCCWHFNDKILNEFLTTAIWKEEYTKDTVLGKLRLYDLQRLLIKIMGTNINDHLNLQCQCTVIPYKKSLIIQFFSIPNAIMSEIEKNDKFEDFHYQNQVDPCDNYDKLTKQEKAKFNRNWNFKKKVWDELMKNSSVPREIGFSFDFMNDSILTDITHNFVEKCKEIDFDIPSNKKEIDMVEEKILSLAMEQDKRLEECYIGTLYDKNFNEELYVIYDDENEPLKETQEEILNFSNSQKVKLTFVQRKDREQYRSEFDKNKGATNIGIITSYIKRNQMGDK